MKTAEIVEEFSNELVDRWQEEVDSLVTVYVRYSVHLSGLSWLFVHASSVQAGMDGGVSVTQSAPDERPQLPDGIKPPIWAEVSTPSAI